MQIFVIADKKNPQKFQSVMDIIPGICESLHNLATPIYYLDTQATYTRRRPNCSNPEPAERKQEDITVHTTNDFFELRQFISYPHNYDLVITEPQDRNLRHFRKAYPQAEIIRETISRLQISHLVLIHGDQEGSHNGKDIFNHNVAQIVQDFAELTKLESQIELRDAIRFYWHRAASKKWEKIVRTADATRPKDFTSNARAPFRPDGMACEIVQLFPEPGKNGF